VGFEDVKKLPHFDTVDADTVEAVLEEAAKFASGVLAPLNWARRPAGRQRRERCRAGAG